jgi:hypothetical protein
MMNDYEIDFREGRIKGNPTICFVRDYEKYYGGAEETATVDAQAVDAPLLLGV